jgi:S-DNA-T family DNA segregation ATPase FtsK/SpoIIIE
MGLPLFAPRRSAPETPANTRLPGLSRIVGPNVAAHARGREVAALLLWVGAVFLALALASFGGDPALGTTGANWVGPVGEACARGLVYLVGVVAWALPLELVLLGIPFVRSKDSLVTPARVAGDLLIAIVAAALVQVGWPGAKAFEAHSAAGAVGELFGELGRSLFSTIGSFLVGFACLGLILIGRASFSFIALLEFIARLGKQSAEGTARGARSVAEAWQTARQIEKEKAEQERIAKLPKVADPNADDVATIAILEGDDATVPTPAIDSSEADAGDGVRLDAEALKPKRTRKKPSPKPEPAAEAALLEPMPELSPAPPTVTLNESPDPVEAALVDDAPTDKSDKAKGKKKAKKDDAPEALTIVDTSAALEKNVAAKPAKEKEKPVTSFVLPKVDFLEPSQPGTTPQVDKEKLYEVAQKLEKALAVYGVKGKVEEVLPGPTVTTFEVSMAEGTKVSKVAGLVDDLGMSLATKVRIIAPIPGKNRVGFEIPNDKRIPVNLRDLIEDARFQAMSAPLPVVLGRDIQGHPVYADLASMPHVIVAGATGAGKSVGLNVMLTSLLYRRSPEELRLLMIDPKVVELAPFDRIPHMLLPVVTDMKQAANALKWAVDEMERRYQLFADAGTKNIATYNGWVDRVCRGEAKNPLPKKVVAKDHNGLPDEIPPEAGSDEGEQPLPERMASIVIVVDEFADLMMQQGKEVEACVARLAQKARAAGMHVILATQRPSVDVITGMIKANFPTRVAFRVAQKVDSRTILDEQGAEHLLGRGDMLIKLNGTNDTKRVQCPMITEEEVQAVTDHLRAQGEPVYDENILKPRDDEGGGSDDEEMEKDSMYDEAVRLVADTRRCSTSWLQRKLGLGYNRAARIVEMMEKQGVVGPANGSKDREVLLGSI